MLFPKNRVKFTTTFKGVDDPEGWIVLDMQGADIEGASKLYLPVADLDKLRQGGDKASERLKQARALFGDPEEREE